MIEFIMKDHARKTVLPRAITRLGSGFFAALTVFAVTEVSVSAQNPPDSLRAHDIEVVAEALGQGHNLDMPRLKKTPVLSVQQLVKGQAPGLHVQEPSGEPGTTQYMYIRGTSTPLLTKTSADETQPVVFVNGVPFITDRSYVYTIKSNDVNPLGTASNLLAGLDIRNIESCEIITDPIELAKLGPLAANGAIWIVTKSGYKSGRHVNIDAGMSVVMPRHNVKMTNGWDELTFRRQFYPGLNDNKFNSLLPTYLQNTSDANFFGPSSWAGDYYRTAVQYDVNASLGGGSNIANYLVTLGAATNVGNADNTAYGKYNIGFYLNIMPLKGLAFNAMLRYAGINRSRNTFIRDRYAEMEYMPEQVTPIVPTVGVYPSYKEYSEGTIDDNDNKSLNGALGVQFNKNGIYAGASIKVDYENYRRRAFWGSEMMNNVNFVSVFSGYDRRFIVDAKVGYDWHINGLNTLNLYWTGNIMEDKYHYTYDKGIDGDDDSKPTTNGGGYTQYRYLDDENIHYLQSSFVAEYDYNDLFRIAAIARADASSSVQKNHKWLFTPSFGAQLNIKKLLLKEFEQLVSLRLKGSWSRIGRYHSTDRFSYGSIYSSENMAWSNSPIIGSNNGFATITRPYSFGWVPYGIGWPYSEKSEISVNSGWLNNRLNIDLSFYSNRDKDLVIAMPVSREFGYDYQYQQGMEIANKGIELTVGFSPLRNHNGWNLDLNLHGSYNHNELVKLPGGKSQIEVNGRLLKVGESVDRFYLLHNEGSDANGNPVWSDIDGDNVITDKDRVMTGNSLPKFTAGFSGTLRWNRWDLSWDIFGAFGQKAFNNRKYQTYDFANLDMNGGLDAIKEISFWQKDVDLNLPVYNLESNSNAYRKDQDIYLENASYLKLRTISLGYNLPIAKNNSIYIYATGSNLLTISKFSGADPELIDADGIYRGYGLDIPKAVSIGVKCNF